MKIILGGPGCGKTTALVKEVRHYLKTYAPEQIGFVAFTKKAAEEARIRCAHDLNLDIEDMVYFRTIHSLCFRQLGLNRSEVMQAGDYAIIAKDCGITITKPVDPEYGLPTGTGEGDKIIFLEQLARSTGKPFNLLLDKNNLNWRLGEQYKGTLIAYKRNHHLKDFTDMIEDFLAYGVAPRLDVLVVDEAQDLSALHWKVIDKISETVKHLIIAGDDDQTIFRWAGADIHKFLRLDGAKKVLPVSHRLPVSIFNQANKILERISARFDKVWQPRQEAGYTDNTERVEALIQYLKHGSWFCLARHAYLLPVYRTLMEREGFVYEYRGNSSADTLDVKAILAWERLRKNKDVPLAQCVLAIKRLQAELRTDGLTSLISMEDKGQTYNLSHLKELGLRYAPTWVEALRIEKREYYRACIMHGEKLNSAPRIKLATIHAVKGGEADNVAILPDLSYNAYMELVRKPDNEHRVFYVGATRARERLFLLSAHGGLSYAF